MLSSSPDAAPTTLPSLHVGSVVRQPEDRRVVVGPRAVVGNLVAARARVRRERAVHPCRGRSAAPAARSTGCCSGRRCCPRRQRAGGRSRTSAAAAAARRRHRSGGTRSRAAPARGRRSSCCWRTRRSTCRRRSRRCARLDQLEDERALGCAGVEIGHVLFVDLIVAADALVEAGLHRVRDEPAPLAHDVCSARHRVRGRAVRRLVTRAVAGLGVAARQDLLEHLVMVTSPRGNVGSSSPSSSP